MRLWEWGDELFNRNKVSKKQRGADQPPEENQAVTNKYYIASHDDIDAS
jgi:hypothetical protein